MKKNSTFILLKIILISVILMGSISTGLQFNKSFIMEKNSEIIFNYNNTNQVIVDLNINGISYGHNLLWTANTTGTNYEESAVVYFEEMAYIGSCSTHGDGHDKLFAVETKNGNIIWSVAVGPGYVGPVIDVDRVYIGTSSHGYDPYNEYVFCINRSDGEIIWSRNIFGGIPESIQYDNDNIYFTSNLIYALDKYDGSIMWTYQMDDFSVTKPMLKDNAFFTATSGGTMYKINVIDGSLIWEADLSDFSWDNSITADGKGRIFLALYGDRTMNAYNDNTGELIWSYRLHGRSLSFNAYHNDVVFISDTYGFVYALNSSNGELIWEKKIGDVIDISSPTISGGLLFIGTRDFDEGALFALNEVNGDIIWKYKIGASITAPPSIANGTMFCGTDDWNMYAFDFGIGTGNWVLSRYDKNNTAFSPDGLINWQYVSAICTTDENITNCIVKNNYDYDVENIKLSLSDGFKANWYDESYNLLKTESEYYIIDNLSSNSSLTLIITNYKSNNPLKPIIYGPTSGFIGNEYYYTVSTIDPNDEEISYYIDWGDGSFTGWTRTLPSGDALNVSHTWNERNTYSIMAKAKNSNGNESDWSNPLIVSMPHSYTSLQNIINRLTKNYPIIEKFLSPLYLDY